MISCNSSDSVGTFSHDDDDWRPCASRMESSSVMTPPPQQGTSKSMETTRCSPDREFDKFIDDALSLDASNHACSTADDSIPVESSTCRTCTCTFTCTCKASTKEFSSGTSLTQSSTCDPGKTSYNGERSRSSPFDSRQKQGHDASDSIHSLSSIIISELISQEAASSASGPSLSPMNMSGDQTVKSCCDFPITLHSLLEEDKYPFVIRWRHDGKSFIIKDSESFEKYVLPAYFKKARKFNSFYKQLRRYRFAISHNTGRDGEKWTLCWSPEFQRGDIESVRRMEPKNQQSTGKR